MSSRDKNLPYEILTLSHFGFKYCSVLLGVSFHDVVVSDLGKNLVFNYVLGRPNLQNVKPTNEFSKGTFAL